MFLFPKDSVAILRQKGGSFVQEYINTDTVLPGSTFSAEENRKNVVARLRKDPMVFLVLEPVDGLIDEEVRHTAGFRFHVTVRDGDEPFATLRVDYKDALAFEERIPAEDGADEVDEFFDPVSSVLDEVTDILNFIDQEDYSFVVDSCPYFSPREPGKEVNLYNAKPLLENAGFQTEKLSTVSWVCEPVLFVHENDVVLLGSRHFNGEELFLEIKRFYCGNDGRAIEEAVKETQKHEYCAKGILWEDGSWSFRYDLDEETDTGNFLDRVINGLSYLRRFAEKVEEHEGVTPMGFDTMKEQRHYFIHETLQESAKLADLKV